MKRIAVLTSGGDAPGMNAAIRAVVRTAIYEDLEIFGVTRGYRGLIGGDFTEMNARSVDNITQRGGTILYSARCPEFMEPEGRARAAENLRAHDIEGLVVIGGNGSFQGAHLLAKEQGVKVIGVPGTIDNDIYGTDVTIGFHTAMNIALSAIDRLRDTGHSHDRLFLVEVMGRHSGHIALNVGIAGGAEEILVPEREYDIDEMVASIAAGRKRGRSSSIIVVAEGAAKGGAVDIEKRIEAASGYEVRTSILGHVQRGGAPSTRDRVLAARLGYHAVIALMEGRTDVMVGVDKRDTVFVPLRDTWEKQKELEWHLYDINRILAG